MKWNKALLLALFICLVFWMLDWLSHVLGGTETLYYYLSKLGNSFIGSFILVKYFWPRLKKSMPARIVASVAMGLFISLYYLISSYSGLVQQYGVVALTSPPTFFSLTPFLWGPAHMLYFFIALKLGIYLEKVVKQL